MTAPRLTPPQIDVIALKGGLDQVTPAMSLAGGVAREALNYECGVSGGYSRIVGYERFDGHPSPTDAVDPAAARALIVAVPGSGPVRGVLEFGDTVYAFRNNAGATALGIYKSSASGWVSVPLFKTVSFTAGSGTEPAGGQTLLQGGVQALVKRVVRSSGSWGGGTAAGQIIITNVVGGSFAAGAASAGGGTFTLSGSDSQLSLLPGGRVRAIEHNFGGQAGTVRMYGCDGVNFGWEFDGETLAPIYTGITPSYNDTPSMVVAHNGRLGFGVRSSAMLSAPGLPFDWQASAGAAEFPIGETMTDMVSLPGSSTSATLAIFSQNSTNILYGTSSTDWNLTTFNSSGGAAAHTAQHMAITLFLDDRGIVSLETAQEFGNFAQGSLTNQITPFINSKTGKAVASMLCRHKSQYRLFYNDGYGLFVTIVNKKLLGCMPVLFPNPVTVCWESEKADGTIVMYFGSTNGMVYQAERGTSFDGSAIQFNLVLNPASARSPRTVKSYHKAAVEIQADAGALVSFDFSFRLGYNPSEHEQPQSVSYSQTVSSSDRPEIVECEMGGSAECVAMIISGSSATTPAFTINTIPYHYSPRRMMR
jgi:hypothetical protein